MCMKNPTRSNGMMLPVEKCISGDTVQSLSDHELLAVIIGTGTRGMDVLGLSSELLRHFGGLSGIYGAGLRELAGRRGIGLKKAVKIQAAYEIGKRLLSQQHNGARVDTPEKVWRLLRPELACQKREEFHAIILNNKNHMLKKCVISIGTVSEAIIHPREIYRDAIREAGTAVIVAHNHPSGVLVPSKEDIAATRRIKEAGAIIGIELLDHVIIGASSYLSMKEAGYL
jgi:DNA repair protein RadC